LYLSLKALRSFFNVSLKMLLLFTTFFFACAAMLVSAIFLALVGLGTEVFRLKNTAVKVPHAEDDVASLQL
jgi:hypothetical protein